MNSADQVRLIDRINVHRESGRGTDTAASAMRVPVSEYIDSERLVAERQLLNSQATVVGLSALVPEANTYATVSVGDASVIVTRDATGTVAAMLNVCRHRGAEVTTGCGQASRLACQYHGWTYHLDGRAAARRRDEYFDGAAEALVPLPVLEQHGLIWVSADPAGTITANPLSGAEAELAPLHLDQYRLYDSTTFSRPINWKLAVDTFCESYHLSTLHRDTLAPLIHDDFALFDRAGFHGRMVTTRKSFDALDSADRATWSLLPHATILWFLVPNTVLIHQQDHIQLYQSRPGSTPEEAHLSVTLYVPTDSDRSERHWERNFKLLVEVTDTEDFSVAAGIQRGYHTSAQNEIVFGRNEPALQHFHQSLNELLASGNE